MIFDPNEQYLPTKEAAKLYPGPEKPSPRTIARHCAAGLQDASGKRIRLPSVVIRGRRLVLRRELIAFLEAVAREGAPCDDAPPRAATGRYERAERELAAQGA